MEVLNAIVLMGNKLAQVWDWWAIPVGYISTSDDVDGVTQFSQVIVDLNFSFLVILYVDFNFKHFLTEVVTQVSPSAVVEQI